MITRRVIRAALSTLAATGLALSVSATAHAADTPNNTKLYASGGGGHAQWIDCLVEEGCIHDVDNLRIWDDRSDSHGVWVRVEHPNGQYTKVNNSGAGEYVYMELPNLRNGEGMGVTVCLSEKSVKIQNTCRLHWVEE